MAGDSGGINFILESPFAIFTWGYGAMRVQTSKLIEGSVLLKDVQGKSGHPIIKENTVLTEEHITILQKFLIEAVEVSSKLTDNQKYESMQQKQKEEKPKHSKMKAYPKEVETNSFGKHYVQVVSKFKDEFKQWNSGIPIDISKIRQLIIPLLERMNTLDLEVFTLHRYVKAEEYIYHHSVAVSLMSAFLGKQLGYEKGECIQIGLAGLLCDAGMTRVDSDIITKGALLTDKQQEDINNHPTYSSRMIEDLPAITQAVKLAVLQHHERMDGSGYPLGISKDEINPYARILAVSDMYHAMTSESLYKKKHNLFKVIEKLNNQKFSKLDPLVIRKFIKSFTLHSLGKDVRLSNDVTGEIVFIEDDYPTKPLVKLHTTEEIISLQNHPSLFIEDFIQD